MLTHIRSLVLLAVVFVTINNHVDAQCDTGWHAGPLDNGALPAGASGSVRAMIAWDPDGIGPAAANLVIGGSFSLVQGVPVHNIAMRDSQTGEWQAMGDSPPVRSMTVHNGDLYAVTIQGVFGPFETYYISTVRHWSSLQQTWILDLYSEDHGSSNPSAYIQGTFGNLGTFGGDLIVTGQFGALNHNPPLAGIIRWDGFTAHPMGNTSQFFYSDFGNVITYNGELYAAGIFPFEAGNWPHRIARWDGAAWQPLGPGIGSGYVEALSIYNAELIVAGWFTDVGGLPIKRIAAWNGSTWHALNGQTFETGYIADLEIYNGQLIAGGDFTMAGGSPGNRVAAYNGTTWQPLGTGTAGGDGVYALAKVGGELIAGGSFSSAGGQPAQNLARWNGFAWSKFGGGTANAVFAMTNFVSGIVAGGVFQQTIGESQTANITSFDGLGLRRFGSGTNGAVDALKAFRYPGPFGEYELIAGGDFTTAGGLSASRIARWQEDPFAVFPPPAWEAMGAGFNSTVYAIERFNGQTYAGGSFTLSGAAPMNRVAQWNEASGQWQPLGTGMNNTVYTLKEYNGALYAGGAFTTAGTASTGGLARWNGTAWESVNGAWNGVVYALEVHDGKLIIGGFFQGLAGSPSLVQFDSAGGYSALGAGGAGPAGSGTVRAIKSANGKLYVGGSFATMGGVAAINFAMWNGRTWAAVQGGVDAIAYAIASYNGEVHAGGTFNNAGIAPTISTKSWARLYASGVPWFARHPVGLSRNCGEEAIITAHLASGYVPLTFEWRRDSVPLIEGLTSSGSSITFDESSVTISGLSQADAGVYELIITNDCGSVTSAPATLTVIGDCPACRSDINNDGIVNVSDLLAVITTWGACGDCNACPADIAPTTHDCVVDVTDLLAVITSWGPCP